MYIVVVFWCDNIQDLKVKQWGTVLLYLYCYNRIVVTDNTFLAWSFLTLNWILNYVLPHKTAEHILKKSTSYLQNYVQIKLCYLAMFCWEEAHGFLNWGLKYSFHTCSVFIHKLCFLNRVDSKFCYESSEIKSMICSTVSTIFMSSLVKRKYSN